MRYLEENEGIVLWKKKKSRIFAARKRKKIDLFHR